MLSVIIPCYLSKAFINRALEALAHYPDDIEVIVVENGSTELDQSDMQAIIGHASVTLIREPRADLSRARNRGLTHARGDYVYFLDSDDVVDGFALAHLVHSVLANGAEAGVMGSQFVDSDAFHGTARAVGNAVGDHDQELRLPVRLDSGPNLLRRALLTGAYSPVLGHYVFSRSLFESAGVAFAEGYFHEDHAVAFQCLVTAQRVIDTPHLMFYKLLRDASLTRVISHTQSIAGYRQAVEDLERYGSTSDSPSVATLRRLVIARLQAIIAMKNLRVAWGSEESSGLKALGAAVIASVRYLGALLCQAVQPARLPRHSAKEVVSR